MKEDFSLNVCLCWISPICLPDVNTDLSTMHNRIFVLTGPKSVKKKSSHHTFKSSQSSSESASGPDSNRKPPADIDPVVCPPVP